MIGRERAERTSSGIGVGPGVNNLCFILDSSSVLTETLKLCDQRVSPPQGLRALPGSFARFCPQCNCSLRRSDSNRNLQEKMANPLKTEKSAAFQIREFPMDTLQALRKDNTIPDDSQ